MYYSPARSTGASAEGGRCGRDFRPVEMCARRGETAETAGCTCGPRGPAQLICTLENLACRFRRLSCRSCSLPIKRPGVCRRTWNRSARHLEGRYSASYEVIVVDDGSSDGLHGTLGELARNWLQLGCLRHESNRGKGAAVRSGVLAARGEKILFADADGATPIDQEVRLSAALDEGAELAVGSRSAAVGRRRARARLAPRGGRARVRRRGPPPLGRPGSRPAVRLQDVPRRRWSAAVFAGAEPRDLFDLEILALAGRLGYRCVEVPVDWHEVPGGNFRPPRELPSILCELWRLRRRLAREPFASCEGG